MAITVTYDWEQEGEDYFFTEVAINDEPGEEEAAETVKRYGPYRKQKVRRLLNERRKAYVKTAQSLAARRQEVIDARDNVQSKVDSLDNS